MRQTFILSILILLFISANGQKRIKAVRNPYTGLWAIRTYKASDTIGSFIFRKPDSAYFGTFNYHDDDEALVDQVIDSIPWAPAGREYTFGDSLTALKVYRAHVEAQRKHNEWVAEMWAKEVARMKREQFVQDSIFKRNHTYK